VPAPNGDGAPPTSLKSPAAFTNTEVGAGRRLFAGEWRFAAAAATPASLPVMKGFEFAFAGRSNVGKSSLINALTNRNGLARTSNTPGRTQELIFFAADDRVTLVDMPGYGYAAAPKAKVAAWTGLIHAYLKGRANLLRVYVLVDARRGLGKTDDPLLESLDEAAVSYQIVLTKADEVKPQALQACMAATRDALARHPAAFPDVLATSADTGAGIPELRAAVGRLLAEQRA
jgi:GTP-binding protein